MKKMTILLGLVMVVGLASLSFAGTSDSITLTVTPTTNVSVNIVDDTYPFGEVALYNGTEVSTALEVRNDGNANAKWQHNANAQATGTSVAWDLVYAEVKASTDQFRLWAAVAASEPGFPETDKVTTTNADLTGGENIAPDPVTGESLWIKLEMPWAVSDSSEHTATYTITASAIGE